MATDPDQGDVELIDLSQFNAGTVVPTAFPVGELSENGPWYDVHFISLPAAGEGEIRVGPFPAAAFRGWADQAERVRLAQGG